MPEHLNMMLDAAADQDRKTIRRAMKQLGNV